MRMQDAIRLAKGESKSCGASVAVVKLFMPAPGVQAIFPCRAAWIDGLPEDHPMWAQLPHLVGVATDGHFQTEW